MRKMKALFLLLSVLCLAAPAWAGNAAPLFINLTSDDQHRALMAISFGQAQMERGHPLTVYLNDKAVLVASKKNAAQYAEQQKLLTAIAAKGGAVLVCPMCSKKFGVSETDFIAGAKITSPDITGPALFKKDTRTLSW
jgi:sulfur relay (sulfurtransferase) complex TusBCD TusD component (DsrE family)